MVKIETLQGRTLVKIEQLTYGTEQVWALVFTCADGAVFSMVHQQDCCETVWLEDVAGDLDDLVGAPILLAEEVSNPPLEDVSTSLPDGADDSHTWTFYKLATIKGGVTLRWFGTSNGYYSESVDFLEGRHQGRGM